MPRYITPDGFHKLAAEHQRLWKVERPRVTKQVADAAAMGDRSENAEYIYGKKRLREIDGRLHFLSKRLEELEVVRETPDRADRVYFGAWVELEGEDGESLEFRIVGADEFDPAQRFISVESPMARAVMGKQTGDEAVVVRPKGTGTFTILRVWYQESALGEAGE
jgi:transcription elongation factor GreB